MRKFKFDGIDTIFTITDDGRITPRDKLTAELLLEVIVKNPAITFIDDKNEIAEAVKKGLPFFISISDYDKFIRDVRDIPNVVVDSEQSDIYLAKKVTNNKWVFVSFPSNIMDIDDWRIVRV